MIRFFIFILLCCFAEYSLAALTTGIGGLANSMLEPVGFMSDFIYTACFLIGGSFVFASIIKYIDHRRNPLAVTISTVVFLLIAGLFLIALPFAYLIIHNGSPYTLLK